MVTKTGNEFRSDNLFRAPELKTFHQTIFLETYFAKVT